MVALLIYMQSNVADYWAGVSLWAMLLGTTVITALWLEGRDAAGLLKWEVLRLACFAVLLGLAWQGDLGTGSLVAASLYTLLNLFFLSLLKDLTWRDPAPAL